MADSAPDPARLTDYGKFSIGSTGPEGFYIDNYAKHEVWVRWLTAEARLAAAETKLEEYRKAMNLAALDSSDEAAELRARLAAYENLRTIADWHIRHDDTALRIYGDALAALDRLDQEKP